jgi:hypothetical protein
MTRVPPMGRSDGWGPKQQLCLVLSTSCLSLSSLRLPPPWFHLSFPSNTALASWALSATGKSTFHIVGSHDIPLCQLSLLASPPDPLAIGTGMSTSVPACSIPASPDPPRIASEGHCCHGVWWRDGQWCWGRYSGEGGVRTTHATMDVLSPPLCDARGAGTRDQRRCYEQLTVVLPWKHRSECYILFSLLLDGCFQNDAMLFFYILTTMGKG